MKTSRWICASLTLAAVNLSAQTGNTAKPTVQSVKKPHPSDTAYAIVSRDANSRVWQRTNWTQNASGEWVPHVHGYTELATGLYHKDANGNLADSSEAIALLPDGTAAATNCATSVYFPNDIGSGVIRLVTSDGKVLQNGPAYLAFDDGTNSVMIAAVTNSVGQLISSNQVLYPDIFHGAGFRADLLCTVRKSGFESDVVFREQIPDPESLGLGANARVELLTEWLGTPEPTQTTNAPNRADGLADVTLRFGSARIGRGKAFLTDTSNWKGGRSRSARESTPVYKSWIHSGGQAFLVESVPYRRLAAKLKQLPARADAATKTPWHKVFTAQELPSRPRSQRGKKSIQLAKEDFAGQHSVVLDYVEIDDEEDNGNLTFAADATYYVSDYAYMYGTCTINAGAVIKYAVGAALDLSGGVLTCATTADDPAILTAVDDDSYGEQIRVSTGNPSGFYAYCGIAMDNCDLSPFNYLNVYYASVGLAPNCGPVSVHGCQFENDDTAIGQQGGYVSADNVLFYNVGTAFGWGNGDSVGANFVTADEVGTLFVDPILYATNSLFTAVGNYSGNIVGENNAIVPDDTGIFSTSFSGDHYLAANSSYRDQGTTQVDPDLLAEIQTMTTYAPQDGHYPDNDGMPDLGYHYYPNFFPINNIDSDGDGLPDWWEWTYLGTLAHSGSDLDAAGNTLLYDYQNGINPNPITFAIDYPKPYVRSANFNIDFSVTTGMPSQMAILIYKVDSSFTGPDFSAAAWVPLAANNEIPITLPGEDADYQVWVGFRDGAHDTGPVWECATVILDDTPPMLNFDTQGNVSSSNVTITGNCLDILSGIQFSGASGWTNGSVITSDYLGGLGEQPFSTFKCENVYLKPGNNIITFWVTDRAGNRSEISEILRYTPPTPPPPPPPLSISICWPPNNATVVGNLVISGTISDPNAVVVVTGGGINPTTAGIESGNFYANDIPLQSGLNTFTVTAYKWGTAPVSATVAVNRSERSVSYSLAPYRFDSAPNDTFNVNGSAGEPVSSVTVNGQSATIDPDGYNWHAKGVTQNGQCSPTITIDASFASGGSDALLGDNYTFSPSFSCRSSYADYDVKYYRNGHVFSEEDIEDQSWKKNSTASAHWQFWDIDGLLYPGFQYRIYNPVDFDFVWDVDGFMSSDSSSGYPSSWTYTLETLTNRFFKNGGKQGWDFANNHGTVPNGGSEGDFQAEASTDLYSGGRRGDPGDQLLLFTVSMTKVYFIGTTEDYGLEPIPAIDCSLFGEPVHPDTDNTNTGYVIREFSKFDTEDATVNVTGYDWWWQGIGASKLELRILGDGNLDGAITDNNSDIVPKNHSPYGVLVINNDYDSEGTGKPNNQDNVIDGPNDVQNLTTLTLIGPGVPACLTNYYSLRLSLVGADGGPLDQIVRIFNCNDWQTAVPILGPGQTSYTIPSTGPGLTFQSLISGGWNIYAEGITPNGGVHVQFDLIGPNGVVASDAVELRVFELDLMADSDNDDGFMMPDDAIDEESVQNKPGDPGKIIGVNDGDTDGDGIPGFADGFNLDPNNPDDDVSPNDHFAPVILEIPAETDLSVARLRFTYDSSDPKGVTVSGTPPVWTPASGSLRLWKKDGNVQRSMYDADDSSHSGGDFIPGQDPTTGGPRVFGDITKLGFSPTTKSVTFYLEGIAPSGSLGDKQITVELDPDGAGHWIRVDTISITAFQVQMNVNRKDGSAVVDRLNGSVVQIVPGDNPSGLFPNGTYLTMPNMQVQPTAWSDSVTLKLKKVIPSASNEGTIRIYRKRQTDSDYSIFMDELDTEKPLTVDDVSAAWRLDSTGGGVVDLALVAEKQEGTSTIELCRSTARVSSIPCDSANGRIVFVNPNSDSPKAPFDNFTHNAAHTIADAVASMQPDDNILVAQGTYIESVSLSAGCVVAGLAGDWMTDDPTLDPYPMSDDFDFSSLPTLTSDTGSPASSLPFFHVTGTASPLGNMITFGGLEFFQCNANDVDLASGGAVFAENPANPVNVVCCGFNENQAVEFGGALCFTNAANAFVDICKFERNEVEFTALDANEFQWGMGGAIATVDSTLAISNSSFLDNQAIVTYDTLANPSPPPPTGSAGGGGDVYVRNGWLEMDFCRSENSIAGVALPEADPDPTGNSNPSDYFTGDGGSMLVHCPSNTVLFIENCVFLNPTAYGNGGAIAFSYDSSPLARAGFNLTADPIPAELGGSCQGYFQNVSFEYCNGGWQGGAVSVDGREMDVQFDECTFLNCQAGIAQMRDGKGGAVASFGGLKWPYPNYYLGNGSGQVFISGSIANGCKATGNGGALYNTVRSVMTIQENTVITNGLAQNMAENSPPGSDWSQKEGLGGGLYCSAGGTLSLEDCIITNNTAMSSGGGIGIKTARAELAGTVLIDGNKALGNAGATWGNGGGLYIVSSFWNEAPGAATLFEDEGTLVSTSPNIFIDGNTANRWGGGIYAGLSYTTGGAGCRITLENANIRWNLAKTSMPGSSLLPSQIALEQVALNIMTPYADFGSATVVGTSVTTDIGLYMKSDNITSFAPPNFNMSTLAQSIVSQ